MFERTELDEIEVVDHELGEKNEELLEDFAFEVYQQQSEISAERYLSGVDRYVCWLDLMAERADRKDYPATPLESGEGHVYDYFSWLSNTDWSVNTRKSYFTAVQRFYSWVEQTGRGEDVSDPHSINDFSLDAGDLEESVGETGEEEKYLSREEVRQLWQPEHLAPPQTRNELALKLLWYTTIRTKALTEIKLEKIDRDDGRIIVKNLKPGDGEPPYREVVYPPERIEPLLDEWIGKQRKTLGPYHDESEYLLLTHQSPKMRPSHVSRIIKDSAKEAGLNEVQGTDSRGKNRWKVTGHILRHSSITYYANQTDVPIHFTQKQAGHSKIETTLDYVHDDEEAFRREIQSVWQ